MMNFAECIKSEKSILMEGALGERLKREYGIQFDSNIDMGGLVYAEKGRKALEALWKEYAQIAYDYKLPFLATTPTRRTNRERILRTKFESNIIQDNVAFLRYVQSQQNAQMYVGGLVGCRGDAYTGKGALTLKEAEEFHEWEVERFSDSQVDFLYAALMPTIEEAAGMALAIEKYHIPYIISFTISRDGCLIDGTTISDAIKYIDEMTQFHPTCYMTNCVHPKIVREALLKPFNNNDHVHKRFLGIQANTSSLSYAELDGCNELRTSEPVALAEEMVELRKIALFKIFGGCCGTDQRHMEEVAKRIW